ncbi:hypothetical protein ACOI22_11025 [Glaciecola sp. 2405UD65-10]|uniref:hypothetical protein n=1 Tax=Glaciecola sp. 2405UD65-10 TaxID=3397244 RepID=UPI003B5C419F
MKYLNKLQSIAVAVGLTLGFAANADVRINNKGFYELDVEPLDAFGNGEYFDGYTAKSDFPYVSSDKVFVKDRRSPRDYIDVCAITKPIKLKPFLKKKNRIIFTVGLNETIRNGFTEIRTAGFRVGNRANDKKFNSYALDLDPDTGGTFSVYKFHNEKTATRVASLDNLAANYTKKEIKSEDFYFRMVLGSDITWFEIWPVSDHNNSPRQRVNRTVVFTGFDLESIFETNGPTLTPEAFAYYIGGDARTSFYRPAIGNGELIDKLVSCTAFKEKVTEHYVKPVNESYDPSNGRSPILPE